MDNVITARVFETPEIYQDTFVYLDETEPRFVSAEIKMPLFVKPSGLWEDVRTALDEAGYNYVKLADDIGHEFFPQGVTISI